MSRSACLLLPIRIGRAVEEEPVDQIGREERRRYGRAAFDEDVVDAGEGGNVLRRGDDGPTGQVFSGRR